MQEKRYYWLKLYENFFENKVSKFLRKLPGGNEILICYLKFQLKTLKTEGVFKYDGLYDSIEEEIAESINEDANIVKLMLGGLKKANAIEMLNENTLLLVDMQYLIGSEGSSAARVRRHRDKYNMLQCNAPVTIGNGDVTNLSRRDRDREDDR